MTRTRASSSVWAAMAAVVALEMMTAQSVRGLEPATAVVLPAQGAPGAASPQSQAKADSGARGTAARPKDTTSPATPGTTDTTPGALPKGATPDTAGTTANWRADAVPIAVYIGLIVFGLITGVCGYLLVQSLQSGGRVEIESHWGGFGSGLGGWRFSTTLVYFVAAIFFAGLLTTTIWMVVKVPVESAGGAKAGAGAAGGAGAAAGGAEKGADAVGGKS